MKRRGVKANARFSMSKRSQSGIITTVLIILLVLVSIVIVWNLVNFTIKKTSSQISVNQFALKGNVDYYLSSKTIPNDMINVSVHRGTGSGDIIGIKLIFEFTDGTSRSYENRTSYPNELETRVYSINGNNLNPVNPLITNFSDVKKISVHYIFNENNKEGITMALDSTDGPSAGSASASGGETPSGGCTSDLQCDDSNICTTNTCTNPGPSGICNYPANTALCNDGNLCTSSDTCSAGICVGTPNTDVCDDGLKCNTTSDRCSNGLCMPGLPPKSCTFPQFCNNATGLCEGCTNECSSGSKQCSGNNVQTCGNYDADICLEWDVGTACPSGQTCTGAGICLLVGGDCWDPIANPIPLCTAEDLSNAVTKPDKNFILMNDIDASGQIFSPIGSSQTNPFRGTFNGNKHTISNFNMDKSYDYVGLFGYILGGSVYNLKITYSNIIGNNNVGGLTGYLEGGKIINCSFSGTVSGNSNVGGLIGSSGGWDTISNITSSSSEGNVKNREGPTYTSSFGGLIGYSDYNTNISNCYSKTNVTIKSADTYQCGGFVGSNSGNIYNSYSSGNVSITASGNYFGGFVGYNSGNIYNSYSTGRVRVPSGTTEFGGFGGVSYSTRFLNCYWYYKSETGEPTICYPGYPNDGSCTPITTLSLFYNSGNSPMDKWDFVKIWQTNSGTYPTLR